MRVALLSIALMTAALAGCIGADDDPSLEAGAADDLNDTTRTFVPADPGVDFTDAIEQVHDHHLPHLHTAGHGLEQVGHTNFEGFYPPGMQGGWGETDIHDGRDLAALGSVEGELGVTIVDISDPENPEPLSYITSMGAEFDARFTEDGEYLIFGCQVAPPTLAGARTVIGDCQGDASPHLPEQDAGHMTVAYDVSDPANPTLAGAVPTNAAHNVWTVTINGTYYAFTNAAEVIRFDPSQEPGASMEVVAEVPGTHDIYVHEHPVSQDWLLYTGGANNGSLAIYEINDPSDPKQLVDVDGGFSVWHEQTVSDQLIDGRVILVGAGEAFSHTGELGDQPRQKASIVDVTDPEDPQLLSQWELPLSMMLPWANYRYSAHNIDMTPYGQVAMSWYHGGIWVFDVSTQDRQEAPVTLGFFQPHELPAPVAPTWFFQLDPGMVPLVWGGMWTDEGRLVLGDMFTGVYVLEPEWGLLPGADDPMNG